MTELEQQRIVPQPWMVEPATLAVLAALAAGGVEARFVGGSVRDALLGQPIGDIDIATPALPERVTELFEKARIKVVPTGLDHGTVTAIVPPRHFEITTLRRDVETYGRRAQVAFDADWAADAARRDFTINAMFLSPDGTIHDPMGGLPDLRAGRVRFVGDPVTRIAEDVLRLLRYYRFEARFGTGSGDARARAACGAAAHLLPTLSGERVQQELIKLLETPHPLAALQMMQDDGVLAVALPEARRLDRLRRLIEIEQGVDPLLRLAALIEVDSEGAVALTARLRFSNIWRDRLHDLSRPRPIDPQGDVRTQRHALYRLGVERYRDIAVLVAAEGGISKNRLTEILDLARGWTPPVFPLAGRDVIALGIPAGERVGQLVSAMHDWWEEGDFTADRAACLVQLRNLAMRPPA
jgi:poly(A) polymerase